MDTFWYDLPSSVARRNRFVVPDPKTRPLRVLPVDALTQTSALGAPVYPGACGPARRAARAC
jgi:hypothetical protein